MYLTHLYHVTQNSTQSGYIYLDDRISWSYEFCLTVPSTLSNSVLPLAYQFDEVVHPSTHCTQTVIWDSRRKVAKENVPWKLITLVHFESISHSLIDKLEYCASCNGHFHLKNTLSGGDQRPLFIHGSESSMLA